MADQLSLFDVRGSDAAGSEEAVSEKTEKAEETEKTEKAVSERTPAEPAKHPEEAEAGRIERLRRHLGRSLGRPIHRLVLTDNRTRMLSARPEGDGLYLRLHHAFTEADEPTLDAVAVLCDGTAAKGLRRKALAVARAHFRRHGRRNRSTQTPPLRPVGDTFDLRTLRDRVNRDYFDGELEVHITWGQRSSARRSRRPRRGIHIRLGSYDDRHRLVRIHPVLDRPEVPEHVVESIVHHEMLHAAVPPIPGRRRRRVHTREFRRRERRYRHHAEAERWIDTHLVDLDRWRREG